MYFRQTLQSLHGGLNPSCKVLLCTALRHLSEKSAISTPTSHHWHLKADPSHERPPWSHDLVKCKVVRKEVHDCLRNMFVNSCMIWFTLTPMDMECVKHRWVLYEYSYFLCCKHDLFNQLQIMHNGDCMSMCVCACMHVCACETEREICTSFL